MTRINVIDVKYLSDQWLLAEYRELPRVIKQNISTKDAPEFYKLGRGHLKWAKYYSWWCLCRYEEICDEMEYRGFTVNYPWYDLYCLVGGSHCGHGYVVSPNDIEINQQRLIEKYNLKPNFYKWTKREIPDFLKNNA